MSRRHFSALAALAIVAALAVTLLTPERMGREDAPRREWLLGDLESRINDTREVVVRVAGDEVVATLERGPERWTVSELHDYPADWPLLRGLLADLAQARVLELKTENPEYYPRLGVGEVSDPDAAGVLLELALGDQRVGVIVGKEAANRDGQYVRVQGEARSVLIDRPLDVPAAAVGWTDRDIVDVPSAGVAEAEIIHPDGDWVLVRKLSADDTDFTLENMPEGRELQSAWAANSLGGMLAGLRLEDVRPEQELDWSEAVKVRVLQFSGVEVIADAITQDEGHWLRLRAALPEAAAQPATGEAVEADATAGGVTPDRAAAINARVAGWAYRIPEYKYTAMTKRLADLLKTEEAGNMAGS
ncbi:MAG: DUF4340 domain-containing protein [Xanthomonadales bacterium]|nr:DUF4340 domain-containing protein [Xanthomonadales bacterium]NIN58237.1 DUF4340 domain-containing protein [Xanthomonadales bacterium]NIN73589.1 DUF4340 domain-containing protein [Xanthomonadales bacterium]NIO13704.1 DUF4340 domain-containing protein [Xanthomonadales bacterium]NIP10630.1 DUF4340 domain-containing protein [Xanthomonadales bacterium]